MTSDNQKFLAFAFVNADILVETDRILRIHRLWGATRSLLGVGDEALIGQPFDRVISPRDRAVIKKLISELGDNCRIESVLIELIGAAGASVPVRLSGYRVDATCFVTLTAAKLTPAERALIARRDPETGLMARADFEASLPDRVASLRAAGRAATLGMVRIEQLSNVAARMPPDAAERMMDEIGGLLRQYALDGETAGRLDGNAFGVLQREDADAAGMERDLVDLVADRTAVPRADLAVESATVPIPVTGIDTDTTQKLVLYTLKTFAETTRRPFTERQITGGFRVMLGDVFNRTATLRDTIRDRAFVVALQPIVTLTDPPLLHHYEALIRFDGDHSPYDTIKLAENAGLVCDLDLLMAARAIGMLEAAAAEGREAHVSVNLSAISLETDAFISAFRDLVGGYRSLRSGLILEITESMEIKDLSAAERKLQQLRQDGHPVCLDDFGAGAASFSYVNALTVDYVKIDGAYVREIKSRPRNIAIIKAMVALCRALEVEMIAEMVEHDTDVEILRSHGIDYGQGFLFGRPLITPTVPAEWVPPAAALRSLG